MISVLCIGRYDKMGKFNKIQWEYFMKWCQLQCNKVIIYSRMQYNAISAKFPYYCNINSLEKPDDTLNVYAYEIYVTNATFWNYIKNFNYDIDVSDIISHIYFFCNSRYIASLEIVDCENYIFIEEPIMQKESLLINKDMLLENDKNCGEKKEYIDDLLQKENWKPLGSI